MFREIRNDTFIGLEESLEELIVENSQLEQLPVVSNINFLLILCQWALKI